MGNFILALRDVGNGGNWGVWGNVWNEASLGVMGGMCGTNRL